MKRLGLLTGLAIAVLLPPGAFADDQHMVMQPDGLKWTAGPPAMPKGAQIAVLSGDPGKAEPYVLRAKLPAGYKVPPHTHPTDENVTVISGDFHIGAGDKLDPNKGDAVKPGGFVHVAKGMHHYAWAGAETVIQVHGVGPFSIDYINPQEDPRKTN